MNAQDFERINTWADQYDWARSARSAIIKNADEYPSTYLQRFNLTSPDLPPTGGQWGLWYICPDGLRLQYQPAHTPPHYCPSTKEYFSSPPQWPERPALFDEVIYARRHDALAQYARWNGLAFRMTGEPRYAQNVATILRAYAGKYQNYPLHNTDGKNTRSAGHVHAQTLDEAIWLVDVAWSYDLVRDTMSASDRASVEQNLLRPAVATIERNDMGMSNWQTWHNAGIAAAGFALNDEGMIGFAYNAPNSGFFAQLSQGAAMDGFWWEGSWGYHFFALEPMLYLAEMGSRAGKKTWSQPNLRALLLAPLQMAQPDLRLPPFNDDGGDDARQRFARLILRNRVQPFSRCHPRMGDYRRPARLAGTLVGRRGAAEKRWGRTARQCAIGKIGLCDSARGQCRRSALSRVQVCAPRRRSRTLRQTELCLICARQNDGVGSRHALVRSRVS